MAYFPWRVFFLAGAFLLIHAMQQDEYGKVICDDGTTKDTANECSENQCTGTRAYVCPNGFCSADLHSCSLVSNCPLDRPYVCSNLICASAPGNCRSSPPFRHRPGFHKSTDSGFTPGSMVFSATYEGSSMEITLTWDSTASFVVVVGPTSDTEARQCEVLADNSDQEKEIIMRTQPGIGVTSNLILDPLLITMSPMLSLSTSTGDDFRSDVTVTMEVNPYFDYSSYSLATYDISDEILRIDWTKDVAFENRNGKRIVTFSTMEPGIYAIVYYPRVAPDNYYGFSDCGWPCEYPDEFMFVFFAVIYVTLVISVTFWCIAIQTEQKLIDQRKKLPDKPPEKRDLEDKEMKVEEREGELKGEEEKKEEDHKEMSFSNHNEDIKSQLSEANIDSKDPDDDSMEFNNSGVGAASNLMRQLTSIVIPPSISKIVQREVSEEAKEVFKEEKLEDIHEDEFKLEDDEENGDAHEANNMLEDEKYYTPEVKKELDADDDGNIITEKDQEDQKEPENPVEEVKDEGEKNAEEKKEEDVDEMGDIEDEESSSHYQDKPSAKGLLSPLSIGKKDS